MNAPKEVWEVDDATTEILLELLQKVNNLFPRQE